MNRIKTIKCIGAAGVLFGGLFAASAVFAGGNGDGNIDEVAPLDETEIQEGYHRRYHDDDDDFRRRRRFHDDDDDFRRRRRRFHDDDDDFRRRRRHRRHYYYNETNLGVSDLTFNDLGSELEAEITITGMSGAESVKVDIEAMADVSSACGLAANTINSPLEVQSDGSQTFEQTELQAKELSVVIDTNDSSALATSLSDCAGRLQVQDVQYLDARVDVSQGDQVLTMLCTFKTPTADGEIADENVECVAF